MRALWIKGLLIGLVTEAWLVHGMSVHGDFLQRGEAWKFACFGVGAGIACWAATHSLLRSSLSGSQRAVVFWLVAGGLRILIVPVCPGDDIWRYRWEGAIQLHGFNPYVAAPDSPWLTHLRNADWGKINQRNYAAIYPPLAEAIFAALAAAGNSVWCYKVIFALTDLATVVVLRRLLTRAGITADHVAWYAWSPLAIYAFAGAAHFDTLMILPLLLAVDLFDLSGRPPAKSLPDQQPSQKRAALFWLSGLLLGTSVAVKLVPLALVPVWAFGSGSWRRALGLLPVTLAPLAISAWAYGFPGTPIFATLRQFGGSFRVNDPVWWLVETAGWPNLSRDNNFYNVCTVVVCVALAYRFRRDPPRGMLWVLGAFLLLSPVLHAWYLLWVLPLAVWRRAQAWFVFSISIFGYFLLWDVNHGSGKPWQEPLWLRLVILLPPLLATAWITVARQREAARAVGCQTR